MFRLGSFPALFVSVIFLLTLLPFMGLFHVAK
jgi:hypothetical protein